MIENIAFTGSFDVFTNGHLWLVKYGHSIARKVTIIVSNNPDKMYVFDFATRIKIIEDIIKDEGLDDVEVIGIENQFTVSVLDELGIKYLLRGIRNETDYRYEKNLLEANKAISPNIETLFVFAPKDYEVVSSSFIKNMMGPENYLYYIKKFLPKITFKYILTNIIKEFTEHMDSAVMSRYNVAEVINMYDIENRPYHNLEHVCNMLLDYRRLNTSYLENTLIAAILYHDCVYGEEDEELYDERLSANRYINSCYSKDLNAYQQTVVNLILATNPKIKRPESRLERRIVSLDHLILGKPPEIYDEYAKGIREEYSIYTDEEYKEGRSEFLKKCLERIDNGEIFYGKPFDRYIPVAKSNIERELKRLNS